MKTPRATLLTVQTPQPTRAAPLATRGIVLPTASPPSVPTVATATAIRPPAPSSTPAVIIRPRTPPTQTPLERWRAQEQDRHPFDPPRPFVAQPGTPLLWYDPRTGQSLEIGTLLGDFRATAEFTLRGSDQRALEVPYQINMDFGLTAVSDAIIQRMKDAGYTDRVEAYVLQSDAVRPK